MPALTTSKRKFNKILENISASSSSTSLVSSARQHASAMSTAAIDSEHPSKRTRMSLSGDSIASVESSRSVAAVGTPSRPRPSRSTLSLAERAKSIRLVRKHKEQESAEQRRTPNYAPWSHEQFVERMKSFSDVMRWRPKPDRLSELEWAKRGWICEQIDTVACKGGCEKRIVIKMEHKPRDTDKENTERDGSPEDRLEELLAGGFDNALVDRYTKLVVEGHDEDCLWRKAGCKEDIYHVPMASYDNHVKPGLIERHKSLLNIRSKLPPLNNLKYPGKEPGTFEKALPTELTQSIAPEAFASDSSDRTDMEKRLQLFAIYGWSGEDRGKYSIAFCQKCHQRIGLWMYVDGDFKLDLADAHRIHCPWLNASSQGGRPIWEQMQNCLLSRVRETANSTCSTGEALESREIQATRSPSSVADSEQADKKRMSRLRKAMKSFGGKIKK